MKLPRFLRSRYSQKTDELHERFIAAGVQDAARLNDLAVNALATLEQAGRRAGMTVTQRLEGLRNAARAMLTQEGGGR